MSHGRQVNVEIKKRCPTHDLGRTARPLVFPDRLLGLRCGSADPAEATLQFVAWLVPSPTLPLHKCRCLYTHVLHRLLLS